MAEGVAKASLKEYRSLLPYFRRYRWNYAIGFIFLLAVDAAQVILPQFIRQAVDIISTGAFEVSDVIRPAVVMVALMVIISLGRFLWRFFIHGSSRRIEAELRENLFNHLLLLSYDFYQKNKIGDLMARATNDLNAVRESIGMGLVALVDGTVMATAIIIVIFIQDARTAAWAIIPLPLITILILFFGKAIGGRFRKAHETYSSLSDVVQETFSGMRVIKSFVKEWWFVKKFADTNDAYRDANMGLVRLFGIFFPFITFLSELTILIVLLAGGIGVTQGVMSPGTLVALFRYFQMLIWPLMGAGFVVNMIQRGAVSLGRVNEVMKAAPLIRSPQLPMEAPALIPPKGSPAFALIEIKNLSFEFSENRPALKEINLSIREGSVTGIFGRTGAGKSTLVKAITRMIALPPGTVFIKGIDSSDWDLAALRKLFGVTPQDSFLFSDSIRNNVAYALPSDSETEGIVSAAVSNSALDKDIDAFTEGWNTVIGERGLTLSGGQKQRTAIARSIAADREILILDDSLSSVDAETEKSILDSLFELGRERRSRGLPWTLIIISHRVSALNRADDVIVLDRGMIAEHAPPQELLARGGLYSRTAALQSLGSQNPGSPGDSLKSESFGGARG